MRMSHIYSHIEQQLTLSELIYHTYDNFTKNGVASVTVQKVHSRLSTLKDDWERFSLTHRAITIAANVLNNTEKSILHEHPYFANNVFMSTHENYSETVEKLNALSEHDSTSTPSTFTNSTTITSSEVPVFFNNARLPRMELLKFDGSPSDWLAFKDVFTSLVINNPTVPPVLKLQYLKSHLTGSAALLLKNTTLSADNFSMAWEALIEFYENERLLVHAALQSLFSLKRMTKESAVELEKLYANVTQIQRTLITLQRPVQANDDFFVFMTLQRLDSETVKAWEQHLGSSKKFPSWKQLSDFLMSRLMSLKSYERSKSGHHSSQLGQNSAKSHYQGKPNESKSGFTRTCTICSGKHYTAACPQYINKSVQQRVDVIKKHQLCFNCLGSHRLAVCRNTKRCQKCAAKHHTTIHRSSDTKEPATISNKEATASTSKPEAQVLHSSINPFNYSPSVLLATALVKIITPSGSASIARVLIDQGSEISLVTERIVQRLRLSRTHSSLPLVGIGATKSARTKGFSPVTFTSHFNSDYKISISAYILKKLTSSIPSVPAKPHSWKHLKGLQLADPNYHTPGSIDMILGADVYSRIIEDGIVRGPSNSPVAQRTKLGWIVFGPMDNDGGMTKAHGFHVSIDEELYSLLRRFWILEELPSSSLSKLSLDEQECERHFTATHSRDLQGRYIVKLPFKQPVEKLGESRTKALQLARKLYQRLKTNPEYARSYSKFIEEYEQLQHMKLLPEDDLPPSFNYYLPHHGIIRQQSLTTKLRVVFNGSSPTTSNYSLNDILHTGQKLQTDLFNVLIGFRVYRYVFSTDVEKMFRQIKVHQDHWAFQRILWITSNNELRTYELTTVTYGLACSPYLSLRVFLQLIEDEGHKYPLAVPVLKYGRYVDDIFGGADSIEQLREISIQLTRLCMAGGFSLKKWTSNHPSVLQDIPLENRIAPELVNFEDHLIVHALGLCWLPREDVFQFKLSLSTVQVFTKRAILSTIAKIFDPLGFLSPITISAKIIIQELWTLKMNWDDQLPEPIVKRWQHFVDSLYYLDKFTVPRWMGYKAGSITELHGFCGASQLAMAAVIYLRTTNESGDVTTTLVASKTKVAPLKRLTIPRLELTGAVILTKLVHHLLTVLDFQNMSITMWTDSSITHTWITHHPSKWKDFVHNRSSYIQDTLPQATWRFIPGIENPADLATRGLDPSQLSENSTWWTGPRWLSQPRSEWPDSTIPTAKQELLEQRSAKVNVALVKPRMWDLVDRYSSLNKLLRITARCQRAISLFRRVPHSSINLTVAELENARLFWIRAIQESYFQHEKEELSKGKVLPKSHSLIRLTPFVDASGFLRVGGRLQNSLLPSSAQHPLILPKESSLTILIIADAHMQTLHGGTQVTLAFIRNNYWIIGGRIPVRSFILKCVKCARYRQRRAQQLMGQLPAERLTPSRPFLHTGVDYAGPFTIKTWKGKNVKTYKAYIALFVCYSTSALHLELVSDYTAEGFIAAFKRFTARRGVPSILNSDCGTNLKGADMELQRLFAKSTQESDKLATLLANDGTQWRFNPPSAPHFGGKWEAGVKSVKHHLHRVAGSTSLTFEEFTTLLTQIEAVLNSRPLCAISEDPDDLQALTPNHFLMGGPSTILPEPSIEHEKTSHLSRWQLLRQMLESFWSRWSRECLQRYYARYK